MKRVPVKFVPKLLTINQKETRLAVDRDLLQFDDQGTNFMNRVMTRDDSWVYGYNPETKTQLLQWKTTCSPRTKRHTKFGASRQWCWQFSSIIEASFIISMHQMIKLLTIVLHRSSPLAAWCNPAQATCVVRDDWQLQHDNAPAHSYHLVQNFLPNHQISQVPQPPNSPNTTLSEFLTFPKVKCYWRGIGFKTWRR
jgi:hypothetical protein